MKKPQLKTQLKKLRLDAGYSMSEVMRIAQKEKIKDRRSRITQGYISRLESGMETNPSFSKIVTLCKIYKTTPSKLFSALGL